MSQRFRVAAVITVMALAGVVRMEAARTSCVVVRSMETGETYISDAEECSVRTAPASTFKIPNTLIALETGVITDVDAVVRWDDTPQPIAPWNADHNTRTAMRDSVVWFYRDVAYQIGEGRMREGLRRIGYGRDFFGSVDSFWLDGRMEVSPVDQVTFLSRLFSGRTGASAHHVATLRELILQPGGTVHGFDDLPLGWPAGAELRAKTGNSIIDEERSSWLVGEARCAGEAFVFAARVRDTRELPRRTSVALAIQTLQKMAPESCD